MYCFDYVDMGVGVGVVIREYDFDILFCNCVGEVIVMFIFYVLLMENMCGICGV